MFFFEGHGLPCFFPLFCFVVSDTNLACYYMQQIFSRVFVGVQEEDYFEKLYYIFPPVHFYLMHLEWSC